MNTIDIATLNEQLTIHEDELLLLSEAQLRHLHISRMDLHRVFAEGVELMRKRNVKPRDRERPVAFETLDGRWVVLLEKYHDDPPMDPRR
jgi:hypothetical protein